MNSFETINQVYLRPSRSIEYIEVSNSENSKCFYVYNYEGYSYCVFCSQIELNHFFEKGSESKFHFTTESQLDEFLMKVDLATE